MKLCRSCLVYKNEDEFPPCKAKKDGTLYWCRECKRAREKISRTKRKTLLRSLVRLIKKNIGKCMDCKKTYPYYVMDFDHRDQTIKVSSISDIIGTPGLTNIKKIIVKLLEEIAKCDLVCANCHRERTHKQEELEQRAHSLIGEHLSCTQETGVRFSLGPEFKKEAAKNLDNIV